MPSADHINFAPLSAVSGASRRRRQLNPAYQLAVDAQLRQLLAQPDAPLFSLVDHGRLAAAYAADPALAGCQAVQPSSTTPAAFLLDINEWLRRYDVRVL